MIQFDSITCLKQDDYTGKDNIFLIINNGFPRTIEVGEIENLQTKQVWGYVSLADNARHSIEVWEKDEISPNDLIGKIYLQDYTIGRDQQAVVDNGSASYKLWFKIVEESQ